MKRTRFLLLALLMIYTNWAWAAKPCDFEVDGIYYEIIGENEVAVTTKYLEGSDDDYYSEHFTNGGRWGFLEPSGGSYTGSVSIPSSVSYESKTYRVTTISRQAFYRCTITSISIPNSVINIGKDNDGGSSLFAGCKNLTSINVAEDNPIYDSRNGCNAIIESASNTLISGCRNTTIDNSITTIGRRAFYLVNVDNFTTLPNSVTEIGDFAFDYAKFPIFIIPNSVKKLGDAFYGTEFHIINFSSDSCWRDYCDFDYYKHIHVYNCPNGEIIDDLVFYHDAAKGNILAKYLGNNTNITLPKNYNGENYSIGEAAFDGCTSLTNINIPNTVTEIGDYAFYNCSGLTSITIPNSVNEIGDYAFYGCKNLKTVINCSNLPTFSKGETRYGYIAYYADKVYNFLGADNVEFVDDFVFYINSSGNFLGLYEGNESNIILPENYKGENYSIGESAFAGCTSLTNINIPNSVTAIGRSAFANCSGLTSLTIPNSVTAIGRSAFANCSGLTSLTIPNSVTTIGNEAFYGCRGLTSLTIPNSVNEIGDYAFKGCENLKTIINFSNLSFRKGYSDHGCIAYYADKVCNLPNAEFLDNFVFCRNPYNDGILLGLYLGNDTNIILPENFKGENYSIGDDAFYGCSTLTSITIPNSVTTIGKYAFYGCSGLTSLTIPNSVTTIGKYAFYGCSGLTSLTIPNSVNEIGDYAFNGCKNLKMVINFSNLSFSKGSKDHGSIAYSADKVYNYPNGEIIDDLIFYHDAAKGNILAKYVGNNTIITLPKNYNGENYSIGESAFEGCSGLTSLTIPNSVTTIGRRAFEGCSGLTSLTIPNSVTTIGRRAFYGCSGLTSLTIPNSVTEIGEWAFEGCSGLTSLTIPNSVTTIGRRAFYGCSGLTSLTIPNSVTEIGEWAFYGCSGLTSLTIPNSVTEIGEWAFYGCSGLTSLTIENYVSEIITNAFDGCTSVKELCINGEKFPKFSELPGVEKIILGDKIKEVAEDAFNNYPVLNTLEFHCKRIYDWNFGTSRITDIIIGEEVSVIFGGAFEEIETLERLKVEAMVPPIADDNTFSKLQYRMLEVSVPESAIEDYKADEVWKKFSSIKGYVPTDIEEAITETNQEINISFKANGLSFDNAEGMPVSVYTSAGQLVMHHTNYNNEILRLPKGLYVIRVGNTAKKVVMK